MNDVIYHTTTTKFKLIDRVKILLGSNVQVNSEIECRNESVLVVKSSANANIVLPVWLQKLRQRFFKGQGEVITTGARPMPKLRLSRWQRNGDASETSVK
jgi:hypothetical protein